MKIFGRTQNEDAELELLTETTLLAEPEALRELASFLYRCADAIEGEAVAIQAIGGFGLER